jgi:hypothetical protein
MIFTRSVLPSILSRSSGIIRRVSGDGGREMVIKTTGGRRTVTTLQETLMAQVPEKQAEMAKLKKEHGSHVYVYIYNIYIYIYVYIPDGCCWLLVCCCCCCIE